MSIISEKVAYLKGLAEGMKIDDSKDEGKLLNAIIGVLGEIAEDLEYFEESQDELFDRVFDVEDELYGEEDDDLPEDEFTIECPNCGELFFIDDEDLESDDDIACPHCGEVIEFDFDCDCDCDCGCDCE